MVVQPNPPGAVCEGGGYSPVAMNFPLPFLRLPQRGSESRKSKQICQFLQKNCSLQQYLTRVCKMVMHSFLWFIFDKLNPILSILGR